MAVIPDDIAVELGRTAPDASSVEYAQWELWIADALFQIAKRPGLVFADLDPQVVDYVVRKAVVRHARRPDDATQVTIGVDDGNISKTYRSSAGDVQISEQEWAMLTPANTTTRAFSIRPDGYGSVHMPWCALLFLANYCSCGADLTNYQYPLYEGGVLTEGDDY
jgi:hypothetical protein